MNTLSWLIYAAEALASLKDAAAVCSVLTIIATVLLTGIAVISGGIAAADNDAEALAFSKWVSKAAKWSLASLMIAGALWIASPSSRTIYMIAASEAGEQIATSPDAIEMMGDLKAIIKKRLKDELEAK